MTPVQQSAPRRVLKTDGSFHESCGIPVGTRRDLQESLDFAADGKVRAHIHHERLDNINDLFTALREGKVDHPDACRVFELPRVSEDSE